MDLTDRYFVNVSKETVPPYGVMQMVIPPKDWRGIDVNKGSSEAHKQLVKSQINDLTKLWTDNVPTVYCIKPNLAGEILQDVSLMAFNKGSEVRPGQMGCCKVGAHVNTAIGEVDISPSSLAIHADSWSLRWTTANYGAFKSTGHTSLTFKHEGKQRFATLVIPNYQIEAFRPGYALSSFSFVGQGTFPINGLHNVDTTRAVARSYDPQTHLYYGTKETLLLQVPVMYSISCRGRIKVRSNVPSDLRVLPVTLGLDLQKSSQAKFPDGGQSKDRATFTIPLWMRIGSTSRPVGALEEIPPEAQVGWPEVAFVYHENVFVNEGGVRVYLSQSGSPYLEFTDGVVASMTEDPSGFRSVVRNDWYNYSWANPVSELADTDWWIGASVAPHQIGRISVMIYPPKFA